jgi:hypothetical protein
MHARRHACALVPLHAPLPIRVRVTTPHLQRLGREAGQDLLPIGGDARLFGQQRLQRGDGHVPAEPGERGLARRPAATKLPGRH